MDAQTISIFHKSHSKALPPQEWDQKLSVNLKNPTHVSYQTPTSTSFQCVIYLRVGFYSIFSNDESKSIEAPSNVAEPGESPGCIHRAEKSKCASE